MSLQYYSKWRNAWADFHTPPTRGELLSLARYHYRVLVDGVETEINELIKTISI